MSWGVLAFSTWIFSPIERPASSASLTAVSVFTTLVGSTSRPTRIAFGISARTSSRRFAVSSVVMMLTPVRFPPGCAKLLTRPSLTGVCANNKKNRNGIGRTLRRERRLVADRSEHRNFSIY